MAGGTGPVSTPPSQDRSEEVLAKGKETVGGASGVIQSGDGAGTGGDGSNLPTGDTTGKSGRREPGQCIPKMAVIPSLALQSENLRKRIQYMKDHALIAKFIGIWPTEKALIGWIQSHWKPKGHYDLQLGSKGFFTIIFFNIED